MQFSQPLQVGIFLGRYKRFFADIELPTGVVVAHVPNTGSLKNCLIPGSPALVSHSNSLTRKLPYTLEFLKPQDSSWVGVNTRRSNDLVWEVWTQKRHRPWLEFEDAVREIKINSATRLDLQFLRSKDKTRHHYVEVKNVSLKSGAQAQFPDAVTTRGQKHLRELMTLIDSGHTAEIVFTVQRTDCTAFSPAEDIDPEYGRLLRKALKVGVIVSAWPCEIDPLKIELHPQKALPIDF